jgi:hypothetical protein
VTASRPPDAAGLRFGWSEVPGRVRAAVEDRLGSPVVSAASQSAGFSPGVAARLGTEDGRRFFAKAAGPEPNPLTPAAHRREARVTSSLPEEAPVPRLLHSHDEGEDGWIVLVFEDVEGRNPAPPGLPTLRPFQAAQAEVARTGWHAGPACGRERPCREETNEPVRGAMRMTWTTRGSNCNYPNGKHSLDSHERG